jgi:hypothetical protein
MPLIYNGLLTTDCENYLQSMRRKYGYIVELGNDKEMNKQLFEALDSGLKMHESWEEDSGQDCAYLKKSVHYGLVSKNGNIDNGRFLCLETQEEYDWLIKNHGEKIVDFQPFKTILA